MIDLCHSVNLVLNLLSVEGVQEKLHVLLTVKGNSGSSTDDGCWVNLFNN